MVNGVDDQITDDAGEEAGDQGRSREDREVNKDIKGLNNQAGHEELAYIVEESPSYAAGRDTEERIPLPHQAGHG